MSILTKKKISGALGFIGLAWLSLAGAVAINQRKLVFNPTHEPETSTPNDPLHKIRSVVIYAEDNTRLAGWLLVPRIRGPHPAVIYFGGRSEEVSWILRDAARMFPGMAVLIVNYRGYGESGGIPGEAQFINDAKIVYDWLDERPHIDSTRICIIGRSLGSGVGIQLAAARRCAALLLITPYDSILSIARKKFRAIPVNLLLKHKFESVKYASSLKVPTYILRSEHDDIVPHAHTDILKKQLGNLILDEIIQGSDHCNIPYLEKTQIRIFEILEDVLAVKT